MLYQLSYYRNLGPLWLRNVDKINEKIGKYKKLLGGVNWPVRNYEIFRFKA